MNDDLERAIHARVDARASAQQEAALQARLQVDPEAAGLLEAYRAQKSALQSLGRDIIDEPIPPAMLAAVHAPRLAQRRWLAAAAIAAMAWSAGWVTHGWLRASPERMFAGAAPTFVRDAVAAHVVYTPEVRLGAKVKAPDLARSGYELVGGRLLPGEEGARAQFMYQAPSGSRVTLYLSVLGKDKASLPTAFRYETIGKMSSFYWVDRDFGYALTGELPRDALLKLADAVYAQLGA
jgi:anti-sigma factor RsiW